MYEPPKPKAIFNINKVSMEARLNKAKNAPEMDTQFLNDDGNFILLLIYVVIKFNALMNVVPACNDTFKIPDG
jgi:hypothetical protein